MKATMFVGVGTVVAGLKVMKAAKLAQAITEVAKVADKLDVTTKILSKAGVSLKKIGPKAGKFIARNANGSEILNSGFEVVNGIYKNLKKKTNAHTVFLGYIDAQVQFVGEQTKKVRCKLWGKCRAGSNFTATNSANFRIEADALAPDCPKELIDDVAGEVVTFTKSTKKAGLNKNSKDSELHRPKNGLKKNHIYDIDGMFFKTDHLGRITNVKVDNMKLAKRGERDSYTSYINDMDKQALDDAGHLIGFQFFGPHESINLVPMKRTLNRPIIDLDDPTAKKGAWWYMEKEWQNALNANPKKSVSVDIEIIYGDTKRPKKFEVNYIIESQRPIKREFDN